MGQTARYRTALISQNLKLNAALPILLPFATCDVCHSDKRASIQGTALSARLPFKSHVYSSAKRDGVATGLL